MIASSFPSILEKKCLFSICVMALALSGCGGKSDSTEGSGNDLILQDNSNLIFELKKSSADKRKFGFRYGSYGQLDTVTFQFNDCAAGGIVTVTGYDIDTNTEVQVALNGNQIGYLSEGSGNNSLNQSDTFTLDAISGTNTLTFSQENRNERWGITDLLLAECDAQRPTAGDSTSDEENYSMSDNAEIPNSSDIPTTAANTELQETIGKSLPVTSGVSWTVTNLTDDNELDFPYELIYGPDDYLWITERVGKKVVRVPKTGGPKEVMLDLGAVVVQNSGQNGLLGMAVHPHLYDADAMDFDDYSPFIYLAYTYENEGELKLRIARYTYNNATGYFDDDSAFVLLEGIDASDDHNAGRLKFGLDHKLYYSIGDQGANQGGNTCNEIQAQHLPIPSNLETAYKQYYKGKILRMNLDGTIPEDNPYIGAVRSHIWSFGHRNAQGLVFSRLGTLFSSEHGPKTDDEINVIRSGANYGWPLVAGYYDALGYNYCNWSSTTNCNSNQFSNEAECPAGAILKSEYESPISQEPIGTFNSTTDAELTDGWLSWPTVAPSSIDVYEYDRIPDWNASLLIPTLKRGTIFRTKISANGVELEDRRYYENFHSSNDRYRDTAIDPDGITIYAITDNTGGTSGPSGTSIVPIDNPGVAMALRYNESESCEIQNACDTCVEFSSDSFESNFGSWVDGGSDSARVNQNSNTGQYSVRLRDNSGRESSIFSNPYDLESVDVTISFSFIAKKVDNGESLVLEVSQNGGNTYSQLQRYIVGQDFTNDKRYTVSEKIGIGSAQTVFKLRSDASNNNDRFYLDDISVRGCRL